MIKFFDQHYFSFEGKLADYITDSNPRLDVDKLDEFSMQISKPLEGMLKSTPVDGIVDPVLYETLAIEALFKVVEIVYCMIIPNDEDEHDNIIKADKFLHYLAVKYIEFINSHIGACDYALKELVHFESACPFEPKTNRISVLYVLSLQPEDYGIEYALEEYKALVVNERKHLSDEEMYDKYGYVYYRVLPTLCYLLDRRGQPYEITTKDSKNFQAAYEECEEIWDSFRGHVEEYRKDDEPIITDVWQLARKYSQALGDYYPDQGIDLPPADYQFNETVKNILQDANYDLRMSCLYSIYAGIGTYVLLKNNPKKKNIKFYKELNVYKDIDKLDTHVMYDLLHIKPNSDEEDDLNDHLKRVLTVAKDYYDNKIHKAHMELAEEIILLLSSLIAYGTVLWCLIDEMVINNC